MPRLKRKIRSKDQLILHTPVGNVLIHVDRRVNITVETPAGVWPEHITSRESAAYSGNKPDDEGLCLAGKH